MEKKNSINISLLENLANFFSIGEIEKGELRANSEGVFSCSHLIRYHIVKLNQARNFHN
ncbi:hypothetical protein AB1303_01070 [Saccharolobus solfataricus]